MLCVDADVLCLYGLDRVDDSVRHWLEKQDKRHLLVFDDVEEFASLEHPRAHFFFLPEGEEENIFKEIAWKHLFLKFHYNIPQDHEKAARLFTVMQNLREGIHLIASDWSDLDLNVVKNVLQNMLKMPKAYHGKDFFGKFQDMPAIICGSGPSLAKNVDELKGLENRALIMAGGTALPLLGKRCINIHFSAMIDPKLSLERFIEGFYEDIPLFYQNRVDRQFLEKMRGPLLWMPDAGSSLIERELFEEESFDGGWNVVTFCTALAASLGCSPIIFVGMDLSAAPEKIYAPGVKATAQEEKLILTEGENGEAFYSKRDWLIARSWLEEFIKAHPQTLFLNATEGGIGVPSVKNILLSSAKEEYLQKNKDVQTRVLNLLQQLSPIGRKEELTAKVDALKMSFSNVRSYCEAFLIRVEEIFPHSLSHDGKLTLILFELEEESVYKRVFEPIWDVWKGSILREDSSYPELQKILLFKRILENF
ncbi:MAG: 6-hydroxymethylpterin diphosphokinase MptE-like protein [Chlamydiota bacterium]